MFLGIDPLAEKYPFQSPFAYAANNPIKLIDVNGMGPGVGDETSTHTVEKGETLWSISKQNNTTVNDLRKWNNMKEDAYLIYPGQKLNVSDPNANDKQNNIETGGNGQSIPKYIKAPSEDNSDKNSYDQVFGNPIYGIGGWNPEQTSRIQGNPYDYSDNKLGQQADILKWLFSWLENEDFTPCEIPTKFIPVIWDTRQYSITSEGDTTWEYIEGHHLDTLRLLEVHKDDPRNKIMFPSKPVKKKTF